MDRRSEGPAFFAYADNYLIDVRFGIIVDVEASRAVRQAEVGAARTMLERTEERFGLKPERLAADSAYGSAPMLNWLVEEKQITPHIPVIDKSKREDGTFSREDFLYDDGTDTYACPAGKRLTTTGTLVNDGDHAALPRQHERLRPVPSQTTVLPQHASSQGASQHLRACARPRSITRRQRGLRAVTPRPKTHRNEIRTPETNSTARSTSPARSARRTGRVRARRHCSEPTTPG